jgi:2,3-bisphosphoglycerate-independent phosphoglycerate mutase
MALTRERFEGFPRAARPQLSAYVCMTEYRSDFGLPVAFASGSLHNILGQVLEDRGLKQFRSAETEKYAHVTFFFNGGLEQPFAHETRKLLPSPKDVPTYDKKPEMSAPAVGDAVVAAIDSGQYDFVLVNFANGDMVGHTGVLEAAVQAAETVDAQIGRLEQAVVARGGALLITADHGNLEKMWDAETDSPHTAHTNEPVPFILVDEARRSVSLRPGGALCDVAPTILDLLDIPQPPEMTGRSLIV